MSRSIGHGPSLFYLFILMEFINSTSKDGTTSAVKVLYAPRPFERHCNIPKTLGCELTDEGYIKTDTIQSTSLRGIYACGDSTTRIRTVANAVAIGTTAGMMVNKEIVLEEF
ncbi:MAG TPA: FAD-dependent oxidoreductase [Cyclobacteriaceae bacterium]